MAVGVHAFISETLSVDRVEEAAKLAAAVKLQSSAARMKIAASLTLAEIVKKKDRNSAVPTERDVWREVQTIWTNYKRMTGNSMTNAVVSDLAGMSPSKRLPVGDEPEKTKKSIFEKKLRDVLQLE